MTDEEKTQYNLSLSGDRVTKTLRTEDKKKSNGQMWYYLGAFGNIGFTIAIPIVAGALIGSWIDTKQGSKPMATLAGIIIGLIISMIGFIQMIRKILRGDLNPKK